MSDSTPIQKSIQEFWLFILCLGILFSGVYAYWWHGTRPYSTENFHKLNACVASKVKSDIERGIIATNDSVSEYETECSFEEKAKDIAAESKNIISKQQSAIDSLKINRP